LYWFRTPPGVRIGRSALDEDAIRLIEEHNPDVDFDWTRILKGQDGPNEPRPASQPEHRNRPRSNNAASRPPAPPRDFVETAYIAPVVELADPSFVPTPPVEMAGPDEVGSVGRPVPALGWIEPSEEAVIEEFLVEPRIEPPAVRPQAGDALSAVEARLGSEGLSRLRARYSEVLARISETVSDPGRQDELKLQAERLNPDTWVTEAEVGAGLESYETVFETLRSAVGARRRRRRRGSGRRREQAPDAAPADSSAAAPRDELVGRDQSEEDETEE
jgi:hypothetical protein